MVVVRVAGRAAGADRRTPSTLSGTPGTGDRGAAVTRGARRPGPPASADVPTTDERRVAAAFAAHPRWVFLPPEQHAHAGEDEPLPLGHGQTSSQPSTVAAMLRLLDVPVGAAVLDVGSGSGWTTALLGHLVGEGGRVVGVERIPALAAWGAANVAARAQPWTRVVAATPGVLGVPGEAPFDRVLVSAGAEELPAALVDQLADGGVLVAPVARTMLRVVRGPDGRLDVTEHGAYRFVPLL